MNRHLVRGLLALYPRAFRDRYGAELARLTDELIREGEITPLLAALNLVGGAALEWGRVLTDSRRAALAVAVAAIMAAAGSFIVAVAGISYVTGHARPPSTVAGVRSASAHAVIAQPAAGCAFVANPASLGAFKSAAGTNAAERGQVSEVLVILVPGQLSIKTRPLPSPVPVPLETCVIWLRSLPSGSNPAVGLILSTPSS